jgi:hypothetical protein
MSLIQNRKDPIKKAHFVGSSAVVTIDPVHVRRLRIDDETFFVQKPVRSGILLEAYKLNTKQEEKDEK